MTAVIVLLTPTSSSSSSVTDRVADLRGIRAPCTSPSDQRPCEAPETHSAPRRLPQHHESLQTSYFWRGIGQKGQVSDWIFPPFPLVFFTPVIGTAANPIFAPFLPLQSTADAIFLGVFCQKNLYTYILAPFDSSPGGCHPIRCSCKMCLNGL